MTLAASGVIIVLASFSSVCINAQDSPFWEAKNSFPNFDLELHYSIRSIYDAMDPEPEPQPEVKVTLRLIRSFEHRNIKHFVLNKVNLVSH